MVTTSAILCRIIQVSFYQLLLRIVMELSTKTIGLFVNRQTKFFNRNTAYVWNIGKRYSIFKSIIRKWQHMLTQNSTNFSHAILHSMKVFWTLLDLEPSTKSYIWSNACHTRSCFGSLHVVGEYDHHNEIVIHEICIRHTVYTAYLRVAL